MSFFILIMTIKSINNKIIQLPILNDMKLALSLKNLFISTVTNYIVGIIRFLDYIKFDNDLGIIED